MWCDVGDVIYLLEWQMNEMTFPNSSPIPDYTPMSYHPLRQKCKNCIASTFYQWRDFEIKPHIHNVHCIWSYFNEMYLACLRHFKDLRTFRPDRTLGKINPFETPTLASMISARIYEARSGSVSNLCLAY